MQFLSILTVLLCVFVTLQSVSRAESFEDEALPEATAREIFRYDNNTKGEQKLNVPKNRTRVDIRVSNDSAAEEPSEQLPLKTLKTRKKSQVPDPGIADETQDGIRKHSTDGNYTIALNGCYISDDRAHCSFTIYNAGKVRNFNMYSPTHTAKDNFGNEYRDSSHGRVHGQTSHKIESDTMAPARIEFKVTPNARFFSQLRVGVACNSTEYFTFTNVLLTRR